MCLANVHQRQTRSQIAKFKCLPVTGANQADLVLVRHCAVAYLGAGALNILTGPVEVESLRLAGLSVTNGLRCLRHWNRVHFSSEVLHCFGNSTWKVRHGQRG